MSTIAAFSDCCRKWIRIAVDRAERAEQPLREKFLRNMSQRAADILRDDLANRGPVRLSQVENEQKAILLIVRRLAETGEMVIGSGEDTYV